MLSDFVTTHSYVAAASGPPFCSGKAYRQSTG